MTMSLIAGVAAFVLTVLAMPHFITYYKIKKIGGQQMHEDVKQHLAKAGTPTMGGTVFLVARDTKPMVPQWGFSLSF